MTLEALQIQLAEARLKLASEAEALDQAELELKELRQTYRDTKREVRQLERDISRKENRADKYPRTMKSPEGMVVLFSGSGVGTVIGYTEGAAQDLTPVGIIGTSFLMSSFVPYNGEPIVIDPADL